MDKADESLMKLLTRNLDNMYQIDGVCILITKSEKHIQNSIMNIVFFMIIQAARGNRVLCFPYSVLYRPQWRRKVLRSGGAKHTFGNYGGLSFTFY